MGLIDRQMEIIHVPASYGLYKTTGFFFWIFGMLSIILGPILNILQQLTIFSHHYIFVFSFFGEISPKNENVAIGKIVNFWRMFKIGPNMIDNIPKIQKKNLVGL